MTNQVNNQSLIPSTDVIQLTLTLKMTTAQVAVTSVTVNNSPIQDYVHPDDHIHPTYEMTPGFKPFTENERIEKVHFDLPFAHSTILFNNCQTPLIN